MKQAKAPAGVMRALEQIARNIAAAEEPARTEDPGKRNRIIDKPRQYQSCPYEQNRLICFEVCAARCKAPKRMQHGKRDRHGHNCFELGCLSVRERWIKEMKEHLNKMKR